MPNDLNLFTKQPSYNHMTRSLLNVVTAFQSVGNDELSKSPALESVTDLQGPVIKGAFDDMSKETVDTLNFAYDIYEVRNKNIYKIYLDQAGQAIKDVDDTIDSAVANGDFSEKAGKVLKAVSSRPAQREISGRTAAHLALYTPLADTYATNFGASVALTADKEMDATMKKWNDKCPVWDLIIESENQMDILGGYINEKEKGTLTSEKEAKYRKELLENVTRMQKMAKKVDDTVSDPKLHDELVKDKVFQNDPFHLNTKSARGQASLTASLDAYKKGLENGWEIGDLGVLAAFNAARQYAENYQTTNMGLKLSTFKEDTSKATPKKAAVLKEMNELYKEMTTTKLKPGDEKRNQFMEKMKSLMDRGNKENCFTDRTAASFNPLYENVTAPVRVTEKEVEEQRSRENLKEAHDRKAEFRRIVEQTNKGIDPAKESQEHKELRVALEKLKEVLDLKEKIAGKGMLPSQKQAERIIEQTVLRLDDVRYQAAKYKTAGADKKVAGAAARIQGVDAITKYADKMSYNIDLDYRKLDMSMPLEMDNDMIRQQVATRRSEAAQKKLMESGMPTNVAELKTFMLRAADVLVGKIANSDRKEAKNAVRSYGINGLKDNILDDKHFRNLIKGYLNDKTMTPAKVVAELRGNDGVRKLQQNAKNVKNAQNTQKLTKGEKNRQKETQALEKRVNEMRLGR